MIFVNFKGQKKQRSNSNKKELVPHDRKIIYQKKCNTLCKKCIRSFSGPYFPAFKLITEIYGVNIHSKSPYLVRMWENTDH